MQNKYRNGVTVRDVATQIRYQGDGRNLSLMELDILNHTGCRWSRVIFPGFRGVLKSDKLRRSENKDYSCSNFVGSASPATSYHPSLLQSFNQEFSKIVEGELKQPRILSNDEAGSLRVVNFKHTNLDDKDQPDNSTQIRSIKQKIMDANFSEPRSLIGGSGGGLMNQNRLRSNAFDYGSEKKNMKMSNKFESSIYDFKLETVQEKVNDKSSMTLEL